MLIANSQSEGRGSARVIRAVQSHAIDLRNTAKELFRECLLVVMGDLHRVDDACAATPASRDGGGDVVHTSTEAGNALVVRGSRLPAPGRLVDRGADSIGVPGIEEFATPVHDSGMGAEELIRRAEEHVHAEGSNCLLYTSPSPRD